MNPPRVTAPPPWHPEHSASPELARQLIESRFPDLAPVRVEPFGFGWDNTAFLVNRVYVFRFPRRQLGADCLEAEIHVLPRIASRLPLPIPEPQFIGEPTTDFPWRFAGYRLIEGRTACGVRLSDAERQRVAEPLANFLKALHAIPAAEHRAGPDLIDRMNVGKRLPALRERLQRLRQLELVDDLRSFEEIIEQALEAAAAASDDSRSVLVHGDLYSRHLLVNASRELCGVIDWGDVHCNGPAADLAIVHSFLPQRAHELFRHVYGEIDEPTWQLARFRALGHSAAVTLYSHEAGDADLLREGIASLVRLGSEVE